MSFDNSRNTFDHFKNYSGVVMEQGRVQTDADWNEWLAELSRRLQAGTLDLVGRAVYPATTPDAFRIQVSTDGKNQITIGPGRMYVDGLLVENHGAPVYAWDSALDESSGSPQPPPPPPAAGQPNANAVNFWNQPCVPNNLANPPPAGIYLAYLDVWRRPVTYIEDPSLVDVAIGIETTGRLQMAWQVNLLPVPPSSPWTCDTPDSEIPWPVTAGLLTINTVPSGPSGPCCLTTGTGYTGLENQLYRVEIHIPGSLGTALTPGPVGAATFKWSRENASVQTAVTNIVAGKNSAGGSASVLTVLSLGRDQVLGFGAGNWIEITNQFLDDNCQPGQLYKIDSVDPSNSSITLTTPLAPGFPPAATSASAPAPQYTRISRWDQQGKIYLTSNGTSTLYYDLDALYAASATATNPNGNPNGFYGIPVPPPGTTLILENGITVEFGVSSANGRFLSQDYWSFAARTADGSLNPQLNQAPPQGIHHHRTKLSIVTLGASPGATDCRLPWAPAEAGGCGCCTYTVGKTGDYQTIQAAIDALPKQGGEVCLQPGDHFGYVVIRGKENVVISGCGWQTHVYSGTIAAGGPAASSTETGWPAVFTAIGCTNLEFRSFSVHAARGQVGILLDLGPTIPSSNTPLADTQAAAVALEILPPDADVIITDLQVTAFDLPAIAALGVKGLRIAENRIAMARIESRSPAVYLSGDDLFFERNWVGLASLEQTSDQPVLNRVEGQELLPDVDANDPAVGGDFRLSAAGGIQIGGPSNEVFVLENEIVGGYSNGITLGNLLLLDANGNPGGNPLPTWNEPLNPCATEGSLTLTADNSGRFVAGDVIRNLHIDRNRIHDLGLCGIGPVGFFDLTKTLEVISLENVTISANIITRTLQRPLEVTANYGGGAICLPDVRNLIIRDNQIIDFGATPGAAVCGIFVLLGEVVDISRNHVKETRDLASPSGKAVTSFGGIRAGILVLLVTPATQTLPASDAAALDGIPLFAPGIPALRVQENVVRVAIGLALEVVGFGPFAITGNHFGSGGTVRFSGQISLLDAGAIPGETETIGGALSVAVLNLGIALELADLAFFGFVDLQNNAATGDLGPVLGSLAYSSIGTVLFTNNICQLEAAISGVTGFASVFIASLDHVLFANNHLWLNGQAGTLGSKVGSFFAGPPPGTAAAPGTALMDAFVFGLTVQVCTNRFQESFNFPVWFSGLTWGNTNITSQNISTYFLFSVPNVTPFSNQNLPAL